MTESEIKKPVARRRVATVGTFDGLHRGHRRVLDTLTSTARERNLDPMVICFDRHPLETIAPERAPRFIQWPSERTNTLYSEGLQLLTLEFTRELASLTAEQWLEKINREHGVEVLVVGYDNTFGSDGTRLNISDYREIGKRLGMEVIEASFEPKAASSAIRRLLSEGNIAEANRLLGRPFSVTGKVVSGKKLGSGLGFPTANIQPGYRAHLPKAGVYAVDVDMPDGRCRKGVANIGHQPTIAQNEPERLEVHIPEFSGNLYGERLSVKFVSRLRDEKKFDTVAELKQQIARDIKAALTR